MGIDSLQKAYDDVWALRSRGCNLAHEARKLSAEGLPIIAPSGRFVLLSQCSVATQDRALECPHGNAVNTLLYGLNEVERHGGVDHAVAQELESRLLELQIANNYADAGRGNAAENGIDEELANWSAQHKSCRLALEELRAEILSLLKEAIGAYS